MRNMHSNEGQNWKPQSIGDHYFVRLNNNQGKILFKVIFNNNHKQWISMDNLRLQVPEMVLQYGVTNNLLSSKGWDWKILTQLYKDMARQSIEDMGGNEAMLQVNAAIKGPKKKKGPKLKF